MGINGKGFTIMFNHPLPNDKISGWSKLKALNFADNKFKVAKMTKFVLNVVENIWGKEQNTNYQHFFSFYHNVFHRLLFQGHSKKSLCGKKSNNPEEGFKNIVASNQGI